MSRYTPEQSIADGFTKPVIVEPRPVEFNLHKDELDEAFDEEDLDQEAKEFLAGKASHAETILANPDRITAVCRDIVGHYLTYVEPPGQKAQVVAYNQKLVVAYAQAIGKGAGPPRVHAHRRRRHACTPGQEHPEGLPAVCADRRAGGGAEAALKNVNDALSFVVGTAKWMIGFNAPIEGVLYLENR